MVLQGVRTKVCASGMLRLVRSLSYDIYIREKRDREQAREKCQRVRRSARSRARALSLPDVVDTSAIHEKRVHAGLLRNRLRAFKSGVLAAVFLPFGPFVCAGSMDKSAAVFHILTGEIQFALAAHASAITALAVSDQGVLITASSDADVRVWDLR